MPRASSEFAWVASRARRNRISAVPALDCFCIASHTADTRPHLLLLAAGSTR